MERQGEQAPCVRRSDLAQTSVQAVREWAGSRDLLHNFVDAVARDLLRHCSGWLRFLRELRCG
jgi:hypothetical protein